MRTIRLGKTNLIVNQTGFGCLPIQRICEKQSTHLLTKAYEYGINYFDTARSYTDSEQKIAAAFSTKRDSVIIASKTMALTADAFWKDLTSSLLALQTDYIDIYQFHNPPFCPKPGSINGLYEAMLEAKAKGLILHIGISSHRRDIAEEAVKSGLYSTLQYPMSYLSSENELELIDLCQEHDVGFICMKALAGGLLARSDIAYAYLSQYPILPLWGIQKEEELDEFISYQNDPPGINDAFMNIIQHERKELSGDFCRGCGYCMPCPAGIEINLCARMSLFLRRAPVKEFLSERVHNKMRKIEHCLNCGQCAVKCPYGLNPPKLLQKNYDYYKNFAENR